MKPVMSASEAKKRLIEGNGRYMETSAGLGDVSPALRRFTYERGQKPYAIILSCSDSRAIPEAIFSAGIGELFVIRVAGNVVDDHQLGSIEYAADHLGTPIVVVLGHDRCGAVDAAMNHDPDGHIRYITDEILTAIGDERDEYSACVKNVLHSVKLIEENADIRHLEDEGLVVCGAIYHLKDGRVDFL